MPQRRACPAQPLLRQPAWCAGLLPWLAAALLPAPAAWAGSAAARPPAAAAAAGFLQKTFETGPFSADNVDLANSGKKGFNWYFWNSFGCTATAADAHLAIGDDGALTLGGACGNGSLVSGAARPSDPQRFVGQAFGGGGYFEAEIRIDTTRPQQGHGWPSWWLLSAEHMWYLPQNYWPGQTNGYEHFLEIDAFEAMRPAGRADAYMATVHDWYGTFHKTCPPKAAFCQIITPYHDNIVAPARPIDWSRWHRIATRWVPASATRKGEITFWLDGQQVGPRVSYDPYVEVPPPAQPDAIQPFAWLDRHHLVLILGGAPDNPISVRHVVVWQKDASQNLRN